MARNIEIRHFKIDGDLEENLQNVCNGPAGEFRIAGTFGPVTKPEDGLQYVFVIFEKES